MSGVDENGLPLAGVKVLDFTTLLPGPLATRIFAAAGAMVTKVERPGGEDMRSYGPMSNGVGASWRMLNEGKRILELDLKTNAGRAEVERLLADTDVLVEQFRPGAMERLGLDQASLRTRFPRLIYCSITGYGQTGPISDRAGHDLNYMAETGLLALGQRGENSAPVVPPVLAADIAGGAYPAVMNVLLALLKRQRTGRGSRLSISMSDNLLPFAWWALARGFAAKDWPGGGDALLSGGSPRYRIYRTKDGRFLAAAPLEDRFWQAFCDAIGLPQHLRDDHTDPAATIAAVEQLIAGRTAEEWQAQFEGFDVCCNLVLSFEEAMHHPQFKHLVEHKMPTSPDLPSLPLPLCGGLFGG
jgi:crotonobetainyl-CoA:carnitine CoA-transferase CaiB-like acyl-CoA transferase